MQKYCKLIGLDLTVLVSFYVDLHASSIKSFLFFLYKRKLQFARRMKIHIARFFVMQKNEWHIKMANISL